MTSVLDVGRLMRAARYTYAGFRDAIRYEDAFRQELIVGVISTPIAILLGDTGIERALMLASLMLVLIVELLNSAIEAVVDRIGTEHHELSGRAKDLASAAVFISLINVPLVWGFVLFG